MRGGLKKMHGALSLTILASVVLMAGCTRDTLVYAERSGFNVAITVDPAESLPVEVNAGLKRRVVGVIPPIREPDPETSRVNGEAVNMFSRFDLIYDENESGVLLGTHRISTAFASGAAALEIAKRDDAEEFVEAITDPIRVSLSADPEDVRVRRALTRYVQDTDNKRTTYLALAVTAGIAINQDVPPASQAMIAISDANNAEKNKVIAGQLGLI
ncbi:MAG: hypothetical protein AAGC81_01540 [Pseudomonadota bacterium]